MKEYEIQFSGLKIGIHDFHFEIGERFFETFQEQTFFDGQISSGNLTAKVRLDKKETMLVFDIDIEGNVELPCDRCMDKLNVDLSSSKRIVGKFSDEPTWHEDDLIHIASNAYKIDLSDLFYEFISLSLPSKKVHSEGKCNPEMLKKLEEYRVEEKDESTVDPRWEKLKNLK